MTDRNQVLEEAAKKLETLAGNKLYERAWFIAAKAVRNMKILTGQPQTLNDSPEQIGSVSSAGHASPAGRLVSES